MPSSEHPDPLISANLYDAERLDLAIHRVVVPLWRGLEDRNLLRYGYIWFLRYSRCGEHLKIRFHGPDRLRQVAVELLAEVVDAYLESGDFSKDRAVESRLKPSPPLDIEDESSIDYSNGTFLWTGYRRSPIVLGAKPLLGDDRYVSLFTSCLGNACNLVLSSFDIDKSGSMPYRRRQAVLLMLLATGLLAVFPHREELEDYVVYHRDWLVRAPVLLTQGRMGKALRILDRYENEADRMAPVIRERLRAMLQSSSPGGGPREEAWRRSIMALSRYLKDSPNLDPDPFVQGPLYPCLFKVFHGLANQLGVSTVNEGLAWHLVLRALKGDAAVEGFRLVPL